MRLLDRGGFCRQFPRHCSELDDSFGLFEDGARGEAKQAFHTERVVALLEAEMKDCLVGLALYLFGKGMTCVCIVVEGGNSITEQLYPSNRAIHVSTNILF